jgi:type I restriction enzyme R subunit
MDEDAIAMAEQQVLGDVRAVRDTNAIDARDRWKELNLLADPDRVHQFAPATQADLLAIVAPLQHLRSIRGDEEAYRFDLLMTRLQVELLKGGRGASRVHDLRGRVEEAVELLGKNLQPVKAKASAIKQVRDKDFWTNVEVRELEALRLELRSVMKYQQLPTNTRVATPIFDVTDEGHLAEPYFPRLEGLELVEYRSRVEHVLRNHFSNNSTLQRIRAGSAVNQAELEDLARLVLQVDDRANVLQLAGNDPETRRSLLAVFRGLVGLDPAAVEAAFSEFVQRHPRLSSQQLRFLQMLQNHIAKNGGIEIERLYEPPFTHLHAESLDGLFQSPDDIDELLAILTLFDSKRATA